MWPWNRTSVIALSALGFLASAKASQNEEVRPFPVRNNTNGAKKGHQQHSWRKKKRRKRRPDRPQASCSWLAPFFGHLICRLPFSFNTYERRESVRRRTDVKICVVGSKQAIFGPTQNKFKRLGFPLRPIRLAAPIRPALASSCWKK